MKNSSLLAITLISLSALADLPYAFSSNTKAKASEVNANFNNLDSRTTAQEAKINSNESRVNNLNTRTADLETKNTATGERLTNAEGKVSNVENRVTLQESNASVLDGKVTNLSTRATSLESTNAITQSRLTTAETGISNLASRIDSLESGSSNGNGDQNTVHSITYSAEYKNVGEQFIINGHTYAMFRMPFVEFQSGDRYAVTFPNQISDGSYNTRNPNIYVSHNNSSFTAEFTVDGIAARADYVSDNRTFIANSSGDFSVVDRVYFALNLQVGNSAISIPIANAKTEKQKITGLPLTQFDFVSIADFSLYTHSDELLTELDTLIDYVRIEKLP